MPAWWCIVEGGFWRYSTKRIVIYATEIEGITNAVHSFPAVPGNNVDRLKSLLLRSTFHAASAQGKVI
jgi:hypothetical protein